MSTYVMQNYKLVLCFKELRS